MLQELPGEHQQVGLDVEDISLLMEDVHQFLKQLQQRQQPKWVQSETADLIRRLEEGMQWFQIQ